MAQRLQFSLLPGSRARPSYTGPRQRSTRGFFSPRGVLHMQRYCCAGTLTSHRDPSVCLSGTGAPSPARAIPGAQGSTPGSSSGPPLRTDSSGIRVRAHLQFSLLPISWAQSFFTGPRRRRVREFFLVSSPRGELRLQRSDRTGPPSTLRVPHCLS
ncbi:hypothetical protein NDU88_004085 [Pleurodeles waltl]|uniref:Uncharacterized protein n=1 Tax=Pleurodeles waltl TaxID=8319 RepID=A0AAV7TQY6_PLEWA|nr:hypothetical protein NDU88_004085 [Pleurodeles waltl]